MGFKGKPISGTILSG